MRRIQAKVGNLAARGVNSIIGREASSVVEGIWNVDPQGMPQRSHERRKGHKAEGIAKNDEKLAKSRTRRGKSDRLTRRRGFAILSRCFGTRRERQMQPGSGEWPGDGSRARKWVNGEWRGLIQRGEVQKLFSISGLTLVAKFFAMRLE